MLRHIPSSNIIFSVGRAPQWHRYPGHFLKLSECALTCSTLGKSDKSRHLTCAQIMPKFFNEWIKILPADLAQGRSPQRFDVAQPLSTLSTARLALRIALESFLIAERRMVRPPSTRKAQMKTLLMLIVGLMLAACGSMENHVRNRDAADRNRYLVEHNAVDTICACP